MGGPTELETQVRDPGVTLRGRSASGGGEDVGVVAGAAKVANMAHEPGHDVQAWRTWGGAACELVEITGPTSGKVINGPCWLYGFHLTATGTSTTLDLSQGSAAGVKLAPGIATGTLNVLGYSKSVGVAGEAVFCPDGVYATWDGTGIPKAVLHVILSQPQ